MKATVSGSGGRARFGKETQNELIGRLNKEYSAISFADKGDKTTNIIIIPNDCESASASKLTACGYGGKNKNGPVKVFKLSQFEKIFEDADESNVWELFEENDGIDNEENDDEFEEMAEKKAEKKAQKKAEKKTEKKVERAPSESKMAKTAELAQFADQVLLQDLHMLAHSERLFQDMKIAAERLQSQKKFAKDAISEANMDALIKHFKGFGKFDKAFESVKEMAKEIQSKPKRKGSKKGSKKGSNKANYKGVEKRKPGRPRGKKL